jgi:threonine/homoserine/homoserine lactone efflux protein
VGPIGVLCIRRTLARGRNSGLVSGLGAATADAVYGGVAAFGLTFVAQLLLRGQGWFRLLGGGFLVYLGIRTFLSRPGGEASPSRGMGLAADYLSTFFLTLTNPLTILSFAAIFAGLGLGDLGSNYFYAGALVLGVLCGSSLWWLILSSTVAALGRKFSLEALGWVNRAAGLIIVGFGLLVLCSLRG